MMDSFINFPQDKTLVDLFEEQVLRTPENIAVEFEGETFTYQSLSDNSSRLATFLKDKGISKGELVAVAIERSARLVTTMLAILKVGAAYVPIDPDFPNERISFLLQDSGAELLITEEKHLIRHINDVEIAVIEEIWLDLPLLAPSTGQKISVNDLANVIYTSGSTGSPKGVLIEHRNLVNMLLSSKINPGMTESDSFLSAAALSFDILGLELFLPLITGGKIVIAPTSISKDGIALVKFIERNNITIMQGTPSTWHMLVNSGWEKKLNIKAICGGEYLSTELAQRILERVASLWNVYGPTETTVYSTLKLVTNVNAINIGVPIQNSNIHILDKDLNRLPDGEVGEICISGPSVGRGYLNLPELTRERFIFNKIDNLGEVIYRTGDLGKIQENGELVFIGRADDQVKIRGYRIEVGEIENTLEQLHEVKRAIVTAKPDQSGYNRLIAYVHVTDSFDREKIRSFLKSKLPEYMIPSLILQLETVPQTPNGKVDKNKLPDPSTTRLTNTVYKKANNITEKLITELWQRILSIRTIGTEDNFFELGGTSLLAQRFITDIKAHSISLPIVKLYQYPTISKLAKYLTSSQELPDDEVATSRALNDNNDIAVIGMSGRFPGANSIEELWQILEEGRDTIRFFSDTELDCTIPQDHKVGGNYVRAKGVIDGADQFDADFFNINPIVAQVMDPQHRKFLEVSWEALESSGYSSPEARKSIGVYAGCNSNSYYIENVRDNKEIIDKVGSFQATVLNNNDYIATRLAYSLDLNGPVMTVQSACSTSLLAIAQAAMAIRSGQCEMALAGGVSINVPINTGYVYEEGAILSRDGHCRPFDADAQGTIFCDGAAVVLLKNKKQAEIDGDFIYAVIKGVGISNDGGGKGSFTAPSAEGQALCIKNAFRDGKVEPSEIGFVEGHGTATPIGDPIEIEGLKLAFGNQQKQNFCAVSSIKSNMGHLVHAAGVAGFIKTCLSLHNKKIPATVNFSKVNSNLALENSPFFINEKLTEWVSETVRKAGVSSFGIGGTNVHLILEEYEPQPTVRDKDKPFHMVTWSAKNERSLENYAERLKNFAEGRPNLKIADVAYSQRNKADHSHRRFMVVKDREDFLSQLSVKSNKQEFMSFTGLAPEIVFTFPGQGTQYANMGRSLYEFEPVFRDAIDRCAQLLRAHIDEDIREIIYPRQDNSQSELKLGNTYYTQSALFTFEYALSQLWMHWGLNPKIMIGHSIGEFVAAHLSGVFALDDAIKLIAARSKLIADLPLGGMLAVRLTPDAVREILSPTLSIAAINSPKVCVVSGERDELKKFSRMLDNMGVPSTPINTSHAFHSAQMDAVLEPFKEVVETVNLSPPRIPIISTVTGTWLKDSEAIDPNYWAGHLRLPVLFSDAIKTLSEIDERFFALECGAGNSLTRLIHQQTVGGQVTAVTSIEGISDRDEYSAILRAVGRLWLDGVRIDWKNYYADQRRKTLHELPTYAFKRDRHWIDQPRAFGSGTINENQNKTDLKDIKRVKEVAQTSILHKDIAMKNNELIKKVHTVLENASGIEISRFHPESTFYEIGLDSLLLTQIATILSKEFGLPITFRKLSEEYCSLSLLANYLGANDLSVTQAEERIGGQAKGRQLTSPITVNAGNVHSGADNPVEEISRQLQSLAQQIAVLQSGEVSNAVPKTDVAVSKTTPQRESDITPEEAIELKKPFGATARIERQSQDLSPRQEIYLANLVVRYNEKTKNSKTYTQQYRACMADPRVVSGFRPNTKELVYQLVVKKSEGAYLWDIDGNKYVDMLNGFGSTMLGYQPECIKTALHEQIDKGYEIGPQHELAGEVAELICEFTKHERAALCNTGSEAVLGAMRVARTVTGKNLIVAFSGSYHGIMDEVLVRGTKKLKTFPAASGILSGNVENMLILEYGTDETLAVIRDRAEEIAAVLVEPIQSRRPEFQPIEFLRNLRSVTHEKNITLVFDEVITGFRMHPGGAQALFDIKADIATYGKVVGGGMPIGVIAGNRKYMDALDGGYWEYGNTSIPEIGVTYFAGTFVRHPLTLAAAKAILLYMKEKGPRLQEELNHKTQLFTSELQAICDRYKLPFHIVRFGSLWKIKFDKEYPYSELLFTLMRKRGIHIWDGFPCFLVEAHTSEDLDFVVQSFEDSVIELLDHDFIPTTEPLERQYPGATFNLYEPPMKGALLGKDAEGNPAWFLPDDNIPGKYLQIN